MTAPINTTASNLQPMTAEGVHYSLRPEDAVIYVKADADSMQLHENAETRAIFATGILDAIAELADQGLEEKSHRDPKLDNIQSLAFAAKLMLAEARELHSHAHEAACKGRGIFGYAGDANECLLLPGNPSPEVLKFFTGNNDADSAMTAYESLRGMLAKASR